MMGMGGVGGPEGDRRRRLVALIVVFGMILAAAGTVLSLMLS